MTDPNSATPNSAEPSSASPNPKLPSSAYVMFLGWLSWAMGLCIVLDLILWYHNQTPELPSSAFLYCIAAYGSLIRAKRARHIMATWLCLMLIACALATFQGFAIYAVNAVAHLVLLIFFRDELTLAYYYASTE